jgi:glycerophosphoryl diester phosphodiesterase
MVEDGVLAGKGVVSFFSIMYKDEILNADEQEPRSTEPETPRPSIIAHRGASALAPENTLAAFSRAIKDGAEGIELDVRLSKDGIAVVHHDSTLERTARNGSRISSLTAEELARIDVGSWFRRHSPSEWKKEYAIERVPTLASVLRSLETFSGRIYVELKCREPEVERLVAAVCSDLMRSPLRDQIVVKSFRLAFIPLMRRICPDIRTAALFAPKIMTILRKEKYLVDLACEFGARELSVHYSLATRKLMKKAAKRDLPVAIWTVDHPRWLRRAIKLGVSYVITNDPARLLSRRHDLLSRS